MGCRSRCVKRPDRPDRKSVDCDGACVDDHRPDRVDWIYWRHFNCDRTYGQYGRDGQHWKYGIYGSIFDRHRPDG